MYNFVTLCSFVRMGNVNAAAAAPAAPAPPPECPMHAAEKNKAQATYQASAAEATECPVKHGVDPAAATTASQVRYQWIV